MLENMPETATVERIVINIGVNGKPYSRQVEGRMLLVEFLRDPASKKTAIFIPFRKPSAIRTACSAATARPV